jgi:dihydrolipoamide dehydrogenase
MACVGLTEKQAREHGYNVTVGVLSFAMNAEAHIFGEIDGVIKIVADAKYGEILGIHILGPRATDLISEGALAIKLGATAEDVAKTFHAHPTLSEVVRDAARKIFFKIG